MTLTLLVLPAAAAAAAGPGGPVVSAGAPGARSWHGLVATVLVALVTAGVTLAVQASRKRGRSPGSAPGQDPPPTKKPATGKARVAEAAREVDEALRFPGRPALKKLVSVFLEVDGRQKALKRLFGDVGEALATMVLALHTVGGQHSFRVAHIPGMARWDIAIRLYRACEDRMFCRSGTGWWGWLAGAVKAARQAYEELPFNLVEVKSATVKIPANKRSGKIKLNSTCKAGGAEPLTLDVKYSGSVVILLLKIIDGRRTTLMAVGVRGDDLPAVRSADWAWACVTVRRVADGEYTATVGGKSVERLALGADFLDELQDNLPEFIRKAYYDGDANRVQEPRLLTLQQADVFSHSSFPYLEAVTHQTVVRAGESIGAGTCFAGWARYAAVRRHCDPRSKEFAHLERYTAGPYYPILRRDREFDTWTPDGARRVQEKVTCATFTDEGAVQVRFNTQPDSRAGSIDQYVFWEKDGEWWGGWDLFQLLLVGRREERHRMHLDFAYEAKRTSTGGLSLSERDIEKAWPEAELLCMWNLTPQDLYAAGCFKKVRTLRDGTTEYRLQKNISMVLPPEVAKKLAKKLLVRVKGGIPTWYPRHLTQGEQEAMVAVCTRVRGPGSGPGGRTPDQYEKQKLLNKLGLTVVSKF